MTNKGKIIFRIKDLILKCRMKGKFKMAIKLKNILNQLSDRS
jgi:hypothetical protein